MDETQCPACTSRIIVKDIYISAGPFSIYRDVLLKNMFKYKRLLEEAEKELEELKQGCGLKPYDISAESIRAFATNLKEMLDGCRNSFRVSANDTYVECLFNHSRCRGRIMNISTTGTCVDTGYSDPLHRKGDGVILDFGGHAPGFRVHGEVAWLGSGTQIGVRFLKMDASLKKTLLDYIRGKAQ